MNSFLAKEDYEEPRCLLDMHPAMRSIPVDRIIEKLDSYLGKGDYESAERHLKYWNLEAEEINDMRGKLTVLNELIGIYRKTGRPEEGLAAIKEAVKQVEAAGLENTVTAGTTYVNAATGFKAFGRAYEALPLYEKAREIYELYLTPEDGRLGGLYNNMAVTLAGMKKFKEAEEMYDKALAVMEKQKNGELEMAITYLNMADLVSDSAGAKDGKEKVREYVLKSAELLDTESLSRNGYYAFVCDKCAPVFGKYGYFKTEKELNERKKAIYERA